MPKRKTSFHIKQKRILAAARKTKMLTLDSAQSKCLFICSALLFLSLAANSKKGFTGPALNSLFIKLAGLDLPSAKPPKG